MTRSRRQFMKVSSGTVEAIAVAPYLLAFHVEDGRYFDADAGGGGAEGESRSRALTCMAAHLKVANWCEAEAARLEASASVHTSGAPVAGYPPSRTPASE